MWHPDESDLAPHARGRMEASYRDRERPQCSRDDFRAGYLAALRDLRSRSSFLPGRFEPEGEAAR